MNTAYALGVICGLLGVAVVAFVVGFVMKKKQKDPPKYDERQEAARGRVFKASYFTLLIYLLAYGTFDMITGIVWCDLYTGAFIGAFLSIMVFEVGSIFSGAYFRVGDKPGTYIVIFAFIGFANLALGIARAVHGQVIVDGILTYNSISILVGVACLASAATVAVKQVIDRRDDEVE